MNLTIGQAQAHAQIIATFLSVLLSGLARGNYDPETALTEQVLAGIGEAFPPALVADEALKAFLWLNAQTAPQAVEIPDGHGGMVPSSNSRYDPTTGEFE